MCKKIKNQIITTILQYTILQWHIFPPGIFPSRHLESHAGESSYLSNQFQTSLVVMYQKYQIKKYASTKYFS